MFEMLGLWESYLSADTKIHAAHRSQYKHLNPNVLYMKL
jgi:hypothetical protein